MRGGTSSGFRLKKLNILIVGIIGRNGSAGKRLSMAVALSRGDKKWKE
jgi:hypothetical protein